MAWKDLAATPAHRTYLLLASFLVLYTLFASLIRNRLHLSEPPIAVLFGLLLGPKGLGWIKPNSCNSQNCIDQVGGEHDGGWQWGDHVIQEITRVIVGIQVFSIGVDMPKHYFAKHWRSVTILLGPVMLFGWLVCALFAHLVFKLDAATALTVAATLTPTDPVLSASILSNSKFSTRLPGRLKKLLAAESGLNDGSSFPFLYIGLTALINASAGNAIKEYILVTLLWQCLFALVLGLVIGVSFSRILRFSESRHVTDESGMIAFYLLLAIMCVGAGSTLGTSDFLVAFAAGYGYARDAEIRDRTQNAIFPQIVDLCLNSTVFVYFGAIIPWEAFRPQSITPIINPGKLVLFAVLVLCFRRIPALMATYQWIPDIRTAQEAFFCGHFGPMGLGALFLAVQARAVLETGTGEPLPHPPRFTAPFTDKQRAIEVVWPIVSFVVLCSTFVHGFSVLFISIGDHFRRGEADRAHLPGAETEALLASGACSESENED